MRKDIPCRQDPIPAYTTLSFRTDGVGRVGMGGVEGLEEDRDDGDQEGDGTGGYEYPRAQSDAVREAFQPLVHHEP